MSKKNSLKSNFIYNSVYQLTTIIVPLVTLPYLSRTLNAKGLGAYSFSYSIAYYFYIFIRLGLNSYGNRTIASIRNDTDKLSAVFWQIYYFQLLMGMIITIVYLAYCFVVMPSNLLAFIFTLVVLSGTIDLTWVLYGLEEFKVTSTRDIITKILTTAAIFVLVRDENDVWKYALIYSIGFFACQLISVPIVFTRVHYVRPSFDEVKLHIKPNIILFLPTVAVSFYKTMDKIMLGVLSTEKELGFYHGSENVIRVPLAFITALGTVMLPRMSNMLAYRDDQKETERIFDKSILFVMFISTSICLGIMTVADIFVPVFYGMGFERCISLFYILLPSCLFLAFANVIRTQYLLPRKKDKLFITSLFLGAAVNVLLNLMLIPQYASLGASIGTLTAEIVVCVVQAAFVYKEANIGRNIVNSLPFIISGILMFVVFRGYRPPIQNDIIALLVKIIISGSFYMAVLGIIILAKKRICCRPN
ncbi:flippase [Butyrivibrio sp. AE2015]|uniref:flippase n=1 Tax=Butyrivibrio sp. AE2015 TaxID=1280663 RepID=UPI0003B321D7|nr:flippase [Butyrivibrio sp. AE2015]